MSSQGSPQVDAFKTAATFGSLAVLVFCVGCPLILLLAPGVTPCLRNLGVLLGGVAGFAVAASVLYFYCRLSRKLLSREPPPVRDSK